MFSNDIRATRQLRLETIRRIVSYANNPVITQCFHLALPSRLACQEQCSTARQELHPPPSLRVGVLQANEWHYVAIAIKKRLEGEKESAAKMEAADGRKGSFFDSLIEKNAAQFFVLVKLPNIVPTGFAQ